MGGQIGGHEIHFFGPSTSDADTSRTPTKEHTLVASL